MRHNRRLASSKQNPQDFRRDTLRGPGRPTRWRAEPAPGPRHRCTGRNRRSRRPRSGRSGRSALPAALGLALAPLKSRASRDRQTRVAGKRGVPRGARAPQVGGAPPCLVEPRMPAGSAEPGLCAKLQPHGIGRPVRHERQDMRPCWPRQCYRSTATVAIHERPRLHQERHARAAVRAPVSAGRRLSSRRTERTVMVLQFDRECGGHAVPPSVRATVRRRAAGRGPGADVGGDR